ncbi:glycoside hydrolase family 3 C-terminal domain-containing protein [Butyrivibrio sp. MB2005]|uniref:glycoside hydrolase family 3 C-terminal domain-containing protein n=1 Tax=Butyrivibrio sp. MB2005 TaxID=1280678 RepID=UPI0004111B58|nr:glycoside hydrolase family 3 C-terminal domain-containing protein [Butyrivibrio sp. MB2005]
MSQRNYPGTTSLEITDREITSIKIARKAAAEGMVLLKNDGVLPLKDGEKIALYGGGASYTVKGGTGSGMVNNRNNVSITEGLKAAGFDFLNIDWLQAYDAEDELESLKTITTLYSKTIVILNVGGIIDLSLMHAAAECSQ